MDATPILTSLSCLQYEGGEPCSVCGHRLPQSAGNSQRTSAFPSAVLPHFLYLGSYDHASRSDALKMLEITHILNVSPPSACPQDFVGLIVSACLMKGGFTFPWPAC